MKKNPKMWRDDFSNSKSPLRFFLFSSRPHGGAALIAIITAVIGNALASYVPYIFKMIANAAASLRPDASFRPILIYCLLYILVLGAAKISWRFGGFAAARWATGASATARYSLTSYVTLHSRAYFSDRFAGTIMNKIRHATAGMREIVDVFLWEFLELAVTAAMSFLLAWFVSPLIALIFLVWITVIVIINAYLGYTRVPLAVRAHDLESQINGATVDLLTNVSAMQEYARREFEIERLKGAMEDRRRAWLRSWYYGEWTRTLNSVLLVVFGGAMVLITVVLARNGLISLGDIILVVAIIFRVEGLLQSVGSNFNRFAETWGEVKESLEEVIAPHEIPDKDGATTLSVTRGDLSFQDATFSYDDNKIFERLNLTIPAGQRVGLVGKSGAGKSTLIRLILHHHNLDKGTITIDGTDIASVTQESLRRAISIVPQEPLLFHRTVRENISYGKPDASDAEIEEAAQRAQAHEFILRLPGGYDALVGERGVKLSGGERQRIAIARAILKHAPLLLLDEATSALDSESEVKIQKALHALMEGKTVIAIAHRLSTLRQMDRIIVLDNGKIVEEGSHEQLVQQKGIYAELWNRQAGGFLQD